jgi:hypothetical protein
VASKRAAQAYRVGAVGGEVVETALPGDYLGAPLEASALAA